MNFLVLLANLCLSDGMYCTEEQEECLVECNADDEGNPEDCPAICLGEEQP